MTTTDLRPERRDPRAGAAQPRPARHNSPFTLIVLLAGVFMALLDFFIVNVALPSAEHDLHASSAAIQWVVAGYGLAMAAGLVTGGRLGDLFGRRRVFVLGLLLFTAASAACGLAPNPDVLIGARVAQGLGAAVFVPQILGVIGVGLLRRRPGARVHRLRPDRRARRRVRPAHRRLADPGRPVPPRLALDLLDQRADRPGRRGAGRARAAERAARRTHPARPGRRRAAHARRGRPRAPARRGPPVRLARLDLGLPGRLPARCSACSTRTSGG
jgi:hypothetical protein